MRFQLFLKRQMDFWASAFALVALLPFFLVIAVLIKLDSLGPVFFRYERVGKDGKSFRPFKFRTMEEGSIEKGLKYTIAKKDQRITRVGSFLRKYGIDELPQLINVLLGEMSLVGPRPTFKYQVDHYDEFQKKRLLVKPGMVGWALIHGRNRLSWEERIRYDVWYIEHWCLWLDFLIILKSFYVILIKREGEFGQEGVNDPFDS
ncbi:MAG: sugar transferase [bacterium]|nr:sugar transferase [bacterium]